MADNTQLTPPENPENTGDTQTPPVAPTPPSMPDIPTDPDAPNNPLESQVFEASPEASTPPPLDNASPAKGSPELDTTNTPEASSTTTPESILQEAGLAQSPEPLTPPTTIETQDTTVIPQDYPPELVEPQDIGNKKGLFSNPLLLLIGGGGVILIIIVILVALLAKPKQPAPTGVPTPAQQGQAITIWGLWYDKAAIDPLIKEYNEKNNANIVYVKQEFEHTSENYAYSGTYQERVQERLTTTGGVDIVEIHHSWLPRFSRYLTPAPTQIAEQIKDPMFTTVAQAASNGNTLYMLPLYVDTLVVLYNKDLIPPTSFTPNYTWDDFLNITRNVRGLGIPIGTFSNIYHSPEILLMLYTQSQVNLTNKAPLSNQTEAISATRFYLDFYRTYNLWDPAKALDLKAFANCSIPLVFAPSWRYINFINSNKDLNLGVAPPPIIGGALKTQNQFIGSFWGFAVAGNSRNAQQAWEFLNWLYQPENLKRLTENQRRLMKAAQPVTRRDLAQEQDKTSEYAKVVHSMLEKAVFWPIDYGNWEKQIKTRFVDTEKNPTDSNIQNALNQIVP